MLTRVLLGVSKCNKTGGTKFKGLFMIISRYFFLFQTFFFFFDIFLWGTGLGSNLSVLPLIQQPKKRLPVLFFQSCELENKLWYKLAALLKHPLITSTKNATWTSRQNTCRHCVGIIYTSRWPSSEKNKTGWQEGETPGLSHASGEQSPQRW